MSESITCSVKEAIELMQHMDKDEMITLTVDNIKTFKHEKPKRIKKKKGEELIKQASIIQYQNNDIFGRLSLYGVLRDDCIIHNILFPQLE